MSADVEIIEETDHTANTDIAAEFLTVIISGQRFGIPILQIQDVLGHQSVTRVPLSPPKIAGSLNLRGRIVTAVDVRKRLDMSGTYKKENGMSVVVEHENELYSLIIDQVGDVQKLRSDIFESNPPTLDPAWRDISLGIYRLDSELLVILDVPKLLDTINR